MVKSESFSGLAFLVCEQGKLEGAGVGSLPFLWVYKALVKVFSPLKKASMVENALGVSQNGYFYTLHARNTKVFLVFIIGLTHL